MALLRDVRGVARAFLCVAGIGLSASCGGAKDEPPAGPLGSGGAGGAIADAGAGGAAGSGASGGGVTPQDAGADNASQGDGSAGDAASDAGDASTVAPGSRGLSGRGAVAGGIRMSSEHFTLVTATGESPGGNVVMQSTKYRLRGGVVGVTQR